MPRTLSRSDNILLTFYLAMAVAGLVATGWHNVTYFGSPGDTDLLGYVRSAFSNSASSALAIDVAFVGVVGQVFMLAEGRRIGMPWRWLAALVFGTAAIAIAFTLPLFLIAHRVIVRRREASALMAALDLPTRTEVPFGR